MRVIPGSFHEVRLIGEGRAQKRRLRWVARYYGAHLEQGDGVAEKLNFTLGLDVVGLVAQNVRLGKTTATLITAPGVYFGSAEKRAPLEALKKAVIAEGRRAILVFKRSLNAHAKRIARDDVFAGADSAGRRKPHHSLTATGRHHALSSRVRGRPTPPVPPKSSPPFASVQLKSGEN